MNKRILILSLALILALTVACLMACGGGKMDITIENSEHGSVTADVKSAEAGDEVTLTLTPDAGYYAEKVLVNDVEQKIDGNTCVFVMPNANATVNVTFAQIKYALNIAAVNGGTVTAGESEYSEGESVTLSVTPAYGYTLQSLTVDGQTVTVSNNAYTFTMPSKAVDVNAAFTTSLQTKALPGGSVATLSSNAPAGSVAMANLFVNFGDSNLVVTAYVADKTIISAKDGVYLYFGNSDCANGALTAANIAVKAYVNGSVTVQKGSDAGYVAADASGITATVEPWSKETGVVTGYIATFTVPYKTLNVDKSTAQNVLTLLPYLANADRDGLAFGANEVTFDDYHTYVNPDTYSLVSASGFVDNIYMFGQGQFGSYKDIVIKGNHWNIDSDFAQSAENYANRKVTLNGHDNADNNIAFTRSAGTTSFAKATFKVNALFNKNEMFPKFGLMAYDTASSNSGVFFYVDAEAGKDSNIELVDLVGTSLGYALQDKGAWRWNPLSGTDGSFNLSTKEITLAICYNNGFVYFYIQQGATDRLVGVTTFKAQGDVVLGIKSFALGLEVTNYTATNNSASDDFISHNKRVDGTTVGDNSSGYAYTEGWQFYGDLAENTGSGDQIVYIKDVTQSSDFYAQATVSSPSKVGNLSDEYTKVGAVIKNDNYTIFGYVDLEDRTSADSRVVTNFAIRYETGDRQGQWSWEVGVSGRSETTVEDKSVTMGIAKLGAEVYFIINGKVVATYVNNDIAAQTFVAGIMGFNRSMTVTQGSGTMIVDEVKQYIGSATSESVLFDGVLDDSIWTEEVLASTKTFAENTELGTKAQVAAVKGKDGVYVAVTLYTLTRQRHYAQAVAWSDVANIEFRLQQMNDSNKNDKTLTHYIAFYNYLDGGVSSSPSFRNAAAKVEEVTLSGGKQGYKTTVEFFIPYTYFGSNAANTAELPFYVWTCSFDDLNMPAMNRLFNTTDMFVTEHGIVLRDKTQA